VSARQEPELNGENAPATDVTFEVRYPWGSSYVEQMRTALEALGMVTAENPLVDSDIQGLLFSVDSATLTAGLALVAAEAADAADLDEENAWNSLSDLYDRLGAMGVQWIEQDWKHCAWEDDLSFEHVGLERTLVSASGTGEQHVLVFRLGFPQPDET